MNILFYNIGLSNLDSGGGTQKLLCERAFDVAALCPDAIITLCGNKVTATKALSPQILIAPLPIKEDRQHFLDIFDIVIFFSTIEGLEHTTKRVGSRWVLDLHVWDIQELEKRFVSQLDLICTRSEPHQARTAELINNTVPVDFVYNDIDLEFFRPVSTAARKPHSLAYAGAIVPHKGTEKALQAFVLLKQHIPDLTLDLYGSGAMWNHGDHFENELKKWVEGVVTFHGAVSRQEMPRIFSQHSILILPSDLESFSLVSIEAQACGCIPVLHHCGGVETTVINQETGFLYAPNTFEQLAQTVAYALPRVDTMRDSARQFVASKFDKKKNAPKYAELITKLGAAKV
jgi:glycosyltransferase involved in cell wall biosynthesis